MELKDLKTGFFGYKKGRVCRYISELNSTFGEKLTRQKEESGAIIERLGDKNEELNARVMLLESEKDALRHKNEQLEKTVYELSARIGELTGQIRDEKLKCGDISGILLEAKLFADNLRHKSEEENEIFRSENRRLYESEQRRLYEYGKQVALVKENLLQALRSMDGCLNDMEEKISDLKISDMSHGSDTERGGDTPACASNENPLGEPHSPVGEQTGDEQTGDSIECSATRQTGSAICPSEGIVKNPAESFLSDLTMGSAQIPGEGFKEGSYRDTSKSLSDAPEKNSGKSSDGFLSGEDICGDICNDSHSESRAAPSDIVKLQDTAGTAHDVRSSGGSDSIGENIPGNDGLTYLSSPALNNLNESGDGSYEKQGA